MCLCLSTCGYSTVLADEEELKEAPAGFAMREMRGTDGLMYRIQVSLEDCTGCGLCVQACPVKDKAILMKPYETQKEQAMNWAFAMTLKQKANPVKNFLLKVPNLTTIDGIFRCL